MIVHQPRYRAKRDSPAHRFWCFKRVILANIRDLVACRLQLFAQCRERQILCFQRFLPAGINKHVKEIGVVFSRDRRLGATDIQRVIIT